MNCFEDLQARGLVADCSNAQRIASLINSGQAKPYMGFDATARSLHVGSLLGLVTLRRLQLAGNQVICLLGGATTRVGDPSGRRSERPLLGQAEIQANAAAIEGQMRRIVDFSGANPALLVNNDDWLGGMNLLDFLRDVGKHFPLGQMLGKDSVRTRLEGDGLSFTEFSYQLLQAYDFLHLGREMGCNLQLGGTDQWGNMTAGLELIRRVEGETGACALTLPLMTTAKGAKMGKTAEGAIWLDAEKTTPYAFFQYWINADDRDVERFLLSYTFLPVDEIGALCAGDIRAAKRRLAWEVTALVHGEAAAEAARATSQAAFGEANAALAEDLPTCLIDVHQLQEGVTVVDLLTQSGLCPSRSAAMRLVDMGGAYLGERRLVDPGERLDAATRGDVLLRAGKKRRVRVRVEGAERN